jgi:PBSX family phage terminase large subunit
LKTSSTTIRELPTAWFEFLADQRPLSDVFRRLENGRIRHGLPKTWGTFPKILQLCAYKVSGLKVITGVSKATIYQNVLNDLFELFGENNYSYNRQSGELWLLGSKWLVIGAKDEGSEKYIRGATIGVAVCDEISLMPLSFWNMLLSRMSPKGSRLYATTNPDSPYHWVKTEVLDNANYRRGLRQDLNAVTVTLDDNPNLPLEYKQRVRRTYSGIFYRRFILGEWVLAEGAIYRDVMTDDIFYNNATRPVGLFHRNGHQEHWVSVDVGTVNAFAALEIYDDGRTIWVERELYWDSRRQGRQKTDAQYADDLVAFVGGNENQRYWPGIIIDPAAAHFRTELINRGFFVIDGENSVLEGIRKVSSMIGLKKIRIHEQNKNLIGEMQTYAWNDKRARLGFEEPVKDHDHAPDALRYYVHTRISDWRIASW